MEEAGYHFMWFAYETDFPPKNKIWSQRNNFASLFFIMNFRWKCSNFLIKDIVGRFD